VGMLGLGVEVGLWYAGKRSLQTAADAAALSGALERAKGNPAGVLVAARQEAARNSFNGELPHTILVRNPPESGSHVGNSAAVEVLLGEQQALLFSSLFEDGVTIAARAVAEVQVKGQACVLALHPTAARGIITSGSAD